VTEERKYGQWVSPHALTEDDVERFAIILGSHFKFLEPLREARNDRGKAVVQSVEMWLADNGYVIVKAD
jgi:hypothetical protein